MSTRTSAENSLTGWLPVFLVLGIILNCPVRAQTVVSKTVAGQAFISSEYIVNARPDSIILWLTYPDLLAKIMGYEYCSGAKRLLRVGDAIKMVPQKEMFGQRDTGVIMISSLRVSREMCFTFEPENGKYVYQNRWEFVPSASIQTKILFFERYFDSEGAQPSGKIAEWTRSIKERLARLKAVVERK